MPTAARAFGGALLVLLLLAGMAALAYARWTAPVDAGDHALEAGQFDGAVASYAEAQARFDRLPAVRALFAHEYDRVAANQLCALYRLGRYDTVIDGAARAPEGANPHFWAGLALFAKAQSETKSEAQLRWLSRAEEELRRAIEASPDDWDTKYDYELTTRLVTALRKQPKTPPNQLMQLLRPDALTSHTTRKVG